MRLPAAARLEPYPQYTHEHAKLVPFARSRRRRYRDVHGRAHAPADCQSYRTLGSCLLIRCWDAIRGVTFLVKSGTASSRRRAAGARRLAAGAVGRNARSGGADARRRYLGTRHATLRKKRAVRSRLRSRWYQVSGDQSCPFGSIRSRAVGSLFCRVEVVNSRPGLPLIGSTGIQAPSTA